MYLLSKRTIILFAIVVNSFYSFCQLSINQIKIVDSLKRVIRDAKHDSVRIRALQTWDEVVYITNPQDGFNVDIEIEKISSANLNKPLKKKERQFFMKSRGYAVNSFGLYYTGIGDYDKAELNLNLAISIYKKIHFKKGIASCYNNLGVLAQEKSDYKASLYYHLKGLEIEKSFNDVNGIATSYLNISNIYTNRGNYVLAIEYASKSLKTFVENNNKRGQSFVLNNLGIIYHDIEDYDKALEFYSKALAIRIETNDTEGMGSSFNNLGLIYQDKNNFKKAIEYYKKAIEMYDKSGRDQERGTTLNNIGLIYMQQEKYDSALILYDSSLIYKERVEDYQGISQAYCNIGTVFYHKGNFNKAISFAKRSYRISAKQNLVFENREASHLLWEVYKSQKNYASALKYFEKYVSNRDSILSHDNQNAILRQEYKGEYEKQAAADSVKNAEEKKIKNAQIEEHNAEILAKRNQQIILFGGLALVLLFAGFIFNRLRVTRKQKSIIFHQKEIVDEKNKEITDSINYAKRIQTAILPPMKMVKQYFPDSFILYKPKDIVAGDFYWMHSSHNCIMIAACDCTGHGVPGAMVSVVCNSGLNRAVREFEMTESGKILDKTRELVIAEFEKSEEEVKDGMDIAFLNFEIFNSEIKKLKYSGANNPLWIVKRKVLAVVDTEKNRKGDDHINSKFETAKQTTHSEQLGTVLQNPNSWDLIELKANKQPIGKYAEVKPFTTHELELNKGDTFYIFTDGYQDQFGGVKNKKFKASRLKEIILSIQDKTMEDQKTILDHELKTWQGNNEQNDDICVIGIRI